MNLAANPAAVHQFMQFCAMRDQTGSWLEEEKKLRFGGDMKGISQVPAALIMDMMNDAARRMQSQDIGFRFADWLNPRGFGVLGLLREHCASFAQFYPIYSRYLHLENGALSHEAIREGAEVALVYSVVPFLRPQATYFLDSLVALAVRNLRALLGTAWRPIRVEIERPSIPRRVVQRALNCDVAFNADRHGIIISTADFERKLAGSNPELVEYLKKELDKLTDGQTFLLAHQTSILIRSSLVGGTPKAEDAAALLGLSHRTFQRRLSVAGTDFAQLLRAVRVAVVQSVIADQKTENLASLAYRLGYSEVSTAARFIRTEFDQTFAELKASRAKTR